MNKEKTAENFIARNLESGFLEIHMASKEAFLKLPAKTRELLKNKFRWSRPANCWISKADFDLCKIVADRFIKLGYKDQGWKGSRIPFEKKIMQRLNKNVTIAGKYERRSQILQRNAAKHNRTIEHNKILLSAESDRFKKQDLKRKISNCERYVVSALGKANFCLSQAAVFLERSATLELNLSNPKYLKTQLYKSRTSPRLESQRDKRSSGIAAPPLTDKLTADRLLFTGRIKVEQEETVFFRNRLRNIAESISEDLSMFHGKPVFMSKRSAPDGIGWVVGQIAEDGKLVLKLNDGTYIAKGLERLSILRPPYEILNVLNSRQTTYNEKIRIEGFKAIAMIKKEMPLEAMQSIRKAGLTSQCLIRCNVFLENQLRLKKSLRSSRKFKL